MKNLESIFLEEISRDSLSIIKIGGYTVLREAGESLMYDAEDILELYESSIPDFKGDSLVLGLGLGLLGYNYADNCSSFDYLEINQDIISLMSSYYKNCNLIKGDAFQWKTEKKYDCIFIDIFHKPTESMESQLKILYRKYREYLKPGGEIRHLEIDT